MVVAITEHPKPKVRCLQLSKEYLEFIDTIYQSDLVYSSYRITANIHAPIIFVFNEQSVGYFNLDREKTKCYMNIPKRFIIISKRADILYLKCSKYGNKAMPVIFWILQRL